MLKAKYRILILGAALLVAALPGASINAATSTFPGSITLLGPSGNSAISGTVPVEWKWKAGKSVKSTSLVDVAVSVDGVHWTTVAGKNPIRGGSVDWNTKSNNDYVYAVRALVRGTTIKSVASPLFVDNMAPIVDITRPSSTAVIVDDATVASGYYISGRSTVEARAFDSFSGIASVAWKLDDTDIGEGTSLTYDFGADPDQLGQHTLTVTATDAAGNEATDSVDVVILPGPSSAGNPPEPPVVPSEPPEPPVDPDNPPEPPVDPDDPPEPPTVPSEPPVPLPTP